MGDFMKIWLPGETPWAEVLSVNDDGSRTVRIDNKVAGDYSPDEFRTMLAGLFGNDPDPTDRADHRKHSFRLNDVITVALDSEYGVWSPTQNPRPVRH